MISLGQVRSGTKIIFRDQPFEVVEANHLKMGRGGAKLVTKLRNLLDQSVIDFTFAGDEKIDEAAIRYRAAQFLYAEGEQVHLMTSDDYEQVSLTAPSQTRRFLKEGEAVDLMFWQDRPIAIKVPPKVALRVTYTEPGFKGNTTSTALKPATLETGTSINVPLFIKTDDVITVNTETGAYDSRVS